jgi:ubiquinone/menaquinone biosynthesis C-methylase UbiE
MVAVPHAASAAAFDAHAEDFDRHRALPAGVPEAIRAAILESIGTPGRPRLLDLGAGTGRIGWPFVKAGDDYVGADLSIGMLREFQRRAGQDARLVQSDGQLLPFRDATFDAVLLIQVFGGLRDWRQFMTQTRRVLRPQGALVLGRTIAPSDGLDARMKRQLASMLDDMGTTPDRGNVRDDAQQWLTSIAADARRVTASTWTAERTPRAFLDRHGGGARFSALPEPVRTEAIAKLGAWAADTFGSLDAVLSELYAFELTVFRFQTGKVH